MNALRVLIVATVACVALLSPAWAAPVALAPVAVSSEFQEALDEDIGAREGDVLRRSVQRALENALARRGATIAAEAPVSVEATIVRAAPNRPTLQQIAHRPGLDMGRSISTGGAELRGVIRASDGRVLAEVSHRRLDRNLSELPPAVATWTEANRAIRRFAEKVADAYVAQTQ